MVVKLDPHGLMHGNGIIRIVEMRIVDITSDKYARANITSIQRLESGYGGA